MKKHLTWKNSFIALAILVFSDSIAAVFLALSKVCLTLTSLFQSIPDIL